MDESKAPSKAERIIRIVLIALSVVGIVCAILFVMADSEQTEEELLNLDVQIAELSDELSAQVETKTMTDEEVKRDLASASSAGKAVAEAQNEYATAFLSDEQILAVAEKMDEYLSEDALDARVPWTSLSRGYAWQFLSNYSVADDTIDCVWVCKPSADGAPDELWGYATGVYDVVTSTFSNVKWEMTHQGMAQVEVD